MIESKATLLSYLEADRKANNLPIKLSIAYRLKRFFFPDLVWRYIVVLRKAEYYKNTQNSLTAKLLYFFYHLKLKKLGYKLGFSIPVNVFGPGLSIPHHGTIVINPATKVGRNCRLHVSTNIGASGGSKGAPNIGNNVYIGPGAILFGDISIGDDISIAANATVNKSFTTKNTVIGGSPGKIISENAEVWWVKNNLNL